MTVPVRRILHVDADAFYFSVEQRDNPALRGQPVVVAYHGARSVVTTASYEARRYGVGSAMPLRTALARCPGLIVVEPRMDAYREASRLMQGVFHEFTALVEPLSLDEAYLDVSDPLRGPRSATLIGREIMRLVAQRTGGLTVSVGASHNRFLAKLGSGMNKPGGLTVILPGEAQALIDRLPVGAFYGIGPVTAAKLGALGVMTGAQLRQVPLETLIQTFGRHGEHMFRIARGIDERPVDPSEDRKSIGTEETFETDLRDLTALRAELARVAGRTARRLERHGLAGRVVTLKVKFADFEVVTRRLTLPARVSRADELERVGERLLTAELLAGRAVRLLGLSVADLAEPGRPGTPPPLFRLV